MAYRWKPSKSAAREFAAKMNEIEKFCEDNGIDSSLMQDSYYFTIDGQKYRVSNHTVAASNRGAYNYESEQVRGLYHPNGEEDDTIYITASKTRLIDIYTALKAGKKLNRRGKVID